VKLPQCSDLYCFVRVLVTPALVVGPHLRFRKEMCIGPRHRRLEGHRRRLRIAFVSVFQKSLSNCPLFWKIVPNHQSQKQYRRLIILLNINSF